MRNFTKKLALMLAVIMTFGLVSLPHTTVFAAESNLVEGNGFTVDFILHSNWATGYNAEVVITNTGSEDIIDWVLSANSNLGLGPTGIGSGGRLAFQNAYETVISYLDWNYRIPAGGSVTLWLNGSHTGVAPVPTAYRLNIAELQLVPTSDYSIDIRVHSEWDDRFDHAISLVNTTNRVIQGWQVAFDISGGAWVEYCPIADVVQTTSGSALLVYRPGSGQSWHPGMNLYLQVMGTRNVNEAVEISNVRVYERVAAPYGGWGTGPNLIPQPPNGTPDTPVTTPPPIVSPPSIWIPAPSQPSWSGGSQTTRRTRRHNARSRMRVPVNDGVRIINIWISGNRVNLNLTGIALTRIIEQAQDGIIVFDFSQTSVITVVYLPRVGLRRIAEADIDVELRFARTTVSIDSDTLTTLVEEGGSWIRVTADSGVEHNTPDDENGTEE